ncbi:MAG: hypothetical protein AAB849_01965 [Patescibacteria group bacterium]
MPLSEKEKKELEMLDNPQIEYTVPSTAGIFSFLFNRSSNRKDRAVELRTKMRMDELGLDPQIEHGRYYEIRAEEEKLFDERFNLK